MKENIKKISFLLLLLFALGCNSAQVKKNRNIGFYQLLNRTLNEGKKINYIAILFVKNCDNEIVFSVERWLSSDGLPVYKAYEYNGFPVFYFTNATDKENEYAVKVLDKLLKPSKFNIENIDGKSQDVVYGEFAYFKNGIIIEDDQQLKAFWEHCK